MFKAIEMNSVFKILAVDDDLSFLRLYEIILGRWRMGAQVTVAGSGTLAMFHIKRECPDLLLLDLNLPDVDGLTLLRQLQADVDFCAMTIVAVSGMSARDVDEKGGLPPGVILVSKPVQFVQLEALALILKDAKNGGTGTGTGTGPGVLADRFPVQG